MVGGGEEPSGRDVRRLLRRDPRCPVPGSATAERWRGGQGVTDCRNPSAGDGSCFGSPDSNAMANLAPPHPLFPLHERCKMKISYNGRWAVTDKGLRVCNGLYALRAAAMTSAVPPERNPQFPSF